MQRLKKLRNILRIRDYDFGEIGATRYSCFQVEEKIYLVEEVTTIDEAGNIARTSSFNSYNFSTNELVENIATLNKNCFELDARGYYDESRKAIMKFAANVFVSNKFAAAAVDALPDLDSEGYNQAYHTGKLYYLMVHNQSLLESILKTDYEMLYNLDSIDVTSKSSVKALPYSPSVIEFLKKSGSMRLVEQIREFLSNDDMLLFMDFTTKTAFFRAIDNRRNWINHFVNAMMVCSKDPSIRVVDVLRYVCRQTYLHTEFNLNGLIRTLQEFKDYTNMRFDSSQNEKLERYPGDVFKAHEILRNNLKVLSFKDIDGFVAAVNSYAPSLERKFSYKKEEYITVAPKTLEELFNEGAELHHCVGSYASLIMQGVQIVFLRKASEPNVPWITLEVENGKVVQACKIYNEDVMESERLLLKTYERTI